MIKERIFTLKWEYTLSQCTSACLPHAPHSANVSYLSSTEATMIMYKILKLHIKD